MRNAFLAIERRTTALALAFACAMLVAAACLGLYQIFARFVFQQPAEWSEVLIRFTLIWMVFMGVPVRVPAGRDGLRRPRLSQWPAPRCKRAARLAHRRHGADPGGGDASATAFDYAYRARFQTISGLESFSMTWAYLALPVGGIFCVLGVVGCLLDPRRHELETAQ